MVTRVAAYASRTLPTSFTPAQKPSDGRAVFFPITCRPSSESVSSAWTTRLPLSKRYRCSFFVFFTVFVLFFIFSVRPHNINGSIRLRVFYSRPVVAVGRDIPGTYPVDPDPGSRGETTKNHLTRPSTEGRVILGADRDQGTLIFAPPLGRHVCVSSLFRFRSPPPPSTDPWNSFAPVTERRVTSSSKKIKTNGHGHPGGTFRGRQA